MMLSMSGCPGVEEDVNNWKSVDDASTSALDAFGAPPNASKHAKTMADVVNRAIRRFEFFMVFLSS
jgi:hypothetical protein